MNPKRRNQLEARIRRTYLRLEQTRDPRKFFQLTHTLNTLVHTYQRKYSPSSRLPLYSTIYSTIVYALLSQGCAYFNYEPKSDAERKQIQQMIESQRENRWDRRMEE